VWLDYDSRSQKPDLTGDGHAKKINFHVHSCWSTAGCHLLNKKNCSN